VARFLGGGTLLEGVVDAARREFLAGGVRLPLPEGMARFSGPGLLAVKPEAVKLSAGAARGMCRGTIEHREFLGFMTTAVVALGEVRLQASAVSSPETRLWTPGAPVAVELDWSSCTLFERP
jgi:ABC-type Fe3+/spermidine/putrescine transport system ATPase subunit